MWRRVRFRQPRTLVAAAAILTASAAALATSGYATLTVEFEGPRYAFSELDEEVRYAFRVCAAEPMHGSNALVEVRSSVAFVEAIYELPL